MIRLYDYVLSGSCYKIRLMLSILGLEHEQVPVDFYPGRAHKEPDFLDINPLGQVPVLEDDEVRLRDAQAILIYLAGKYDAGRSWFPKDAASQGDIAMWLSFAGGEIMNASAARLHDMLGYDLDIEKVRAAAHAAFRILDDHLTEQEIEGRNWVAAVPHPTIADIACFPYVALAGDGGISLDDYRAIQRWLDRVKAIPGFIPMPGIFSLL
jgi:glutathione S-transferase